MAVLLFATGFGKPFSLDIKKPFEYAYSITNIVDKSLSILKIAYLKLKYRKMNFAGNRKESNVMKCLVRLSQEDSRSLRLRSKAS